LTPLHAPSTTSPGTHDAHTLNGIDNVGGCNSVWSRFSRILNYITYDDSIAEAKAGIGRYIAFYNARRPHSSLLDRRTPDEVYFESLPLAAAA
jgi:transposase InsO family protein